MTIINVSDFGAIGDGVADDVSAINSAISYANSIGGGKVALDAKPYLVGQGGSQAGTYYGIMMKDNVVLEGPGRGLCTIRAADNSNMIVISNDRVNATSWYGIRGFDIDGNSANNTGTATRANVWFENATNVFIEDVYSYDPIGLGIAMYDVEGIILNKIKSWCENGLVGHDAMHLFDVANLTADHLDIYSTGDDAFAITAHSKDVHDITITNLIVSAPVTSAAAGRGLLLNLSDSIEAQGIHRSMYNVKISGAFRNCKGPAVSLAYAQFSNIDLDISDYGSDYGVSLQVGSSNVTGYVKQSNFRVQSKDAGKSAFIASIVNGVIDGNGLDVRGYNPGDGYVGVSLRGMNWDGNIACDYDPDGTKTAQSYAVDLFTSDSRLGVSARGGSRNINIRANADRNTIAVGSLKDSVTHDLYCAGNNNTFLGGNKTGMVSNTGTGNSFYGHLV